MPLKSLELLRALAVCKKLKISKATLYSWTSPKSRWFRPDFPKSIRFGANSVAWVEQEIDAWLLASRGM